MSIVFAKKERKNGHMGGAMVTSTRMEPVARMPWGSLISLMRISPDLAGNRLPVFCQEKALHLPETTMLN